MKTKLNWDYHKDLKTAVSILFIILTAKMIKAA